jgi:hypothetical protein
MPRQPMALAVEPFLPVELEREIFETAAMRHPKLIPTLLRVCHRVHVWYVLSVGICHLIHDLQG